MKGRLQRGGRLLGGFTALLVAAGLLVAGQLGAFEYPQQVRIPPLKDRPAGPPPAQFSHWAHDRYRCYACHPSLFPQQPKGFTHEDMRAGDYCGACHSVSGPATAVEQFACRHCHAAP